MKNGMVVGFVVGLYLNACLAVINFMPLPPPKLPWFCYPRPAPIIVKPNPFERDCWGIENNYCWFYGYEI